MNQSIRPERKITVSSPMCLCLSSMLQRVMRVSYFVILIFLFLPFQLVAKDKTFGVMAHIEDAFTHEQIEGSVTIVKGDSIIRTLSTYDSGECYLPLNGAPGSRFKCIATAEGYESDSAVFVIPDSRLERINHVFLLNKARKRELEELTVTATAIKMVMNKDTIIYNADAFELSSGSMLDALVRQLPGVELRNGVIKVNGRYVSSLLLNGEDFFSGDPSIALRNLPAFMIKNVKVYGKESDHAYLTGKESEEDKPLVMDVNLKREYAVGWTANIEGGYGVPDNKYRGRGFGLVFSDNLRAALFVNANNINDKSTAGSDGAWGGSSAMSGNNSIINGGVDYLFHNKAKPTKINGSVVISRDKQEMLTETSRQMFFQSGDIWQQQREQQSERNFSVDTKHTIAIENPTHYAVITPYLFYKHGHSDVLTNSLTMNSNPGDGARRLAALDSILIGNATDLLKSRVDNLYRRIAGGSNEQLSLGFNSEMFFQIPNSPDNLGLELSGNYYRQWHRSDVAYDIEYPDPNGNISNRQQNPYSAPVYNLGAALRYRLEFPENNGGKFSLLFTAKYNFDNTRQKNEWLTLADQVSNHDLIMMELDPVNSYRRRETIHKPGANVELEYKLSRFNQAAMSNTSYQFKVSVEDTGEFDRLTNRALEEERVSRFSNCISPKFVFNCAHMTAQSRNMITATYAWRQNEAPLTYKLRYRYTSDPLNIYLPNDNLSRTGTHNANLTYTLFNNRTKRQLGLNFTWQLRENALVNARYYDRETGVSTWMPMNINGNWNTRTELQYSRPLDAARRFEISSTTCHVFENNVDYSSTTDNPVRSNVKNNIIAERLRADWQNNGYSVSVGITAQWHNAASARSDFKTLNLWDILPVLSAIVPLPWKLQLTSDITTTIRYGYNESSINKSFVLWNASLSKGLLDDKLTVKLTAYDILGQVQPFTSTVNAQAITETYRTTLRQYVMLTLSYRLNLHPKRG